MISNDAKKVKEALQKQGLETPLVLQKLSLKQQKEQISYHIKAILETLALDLSDDSLQDTPHRVAKMFVDEIFEGLNYQNFPKITKIANKIASNEMVLINNIKVHSTCEHHFATISGTASVAYVPKDWIIGLSKINRIVRFFAKRPQVQERLTMQLLCVFQSILETDDVAINIKADHFCVKCRGIEDESQTNTFAFDGVFKSGSMRKEFLQHS